MKAWWTLSLPQTSRANPVQCYSTHQKKCIVVYRIITISHSIAGARQCVADVLHVCCTCVAGVLQIITRLEFQGSSSCECRLEFQGSSTCECKYASVRVYIYMLVCMYMYAYVCKYAIYMWNGYKGVRVYMYESLYMYNHVSLCVYICHLRVHSIYKCTSIYVRMPVYVYICKWNAMYTLM